MREIFNKQFGLPKEGFLEPVNFTETKIGFSVYKNRSQKGFKSLFKIYIDNKILENDEDLKPLIITASYGKETENGIIISSSEFKRSINEPIDLSSNDEFFYNIKTHKFYYKKNREISAMDVLRRIDKLHTKPSKSFKGAFLRFKIILFRTVIAFIFKFLFILFSEIKYLLSGEKPEIFFNLNEKASEYEQTATNIGNSKISQSEQINIFGYKVDSQIAFMYGMFHLIMYAIFYKYNYRPIWLITIFNNIFLTVMYVIISIGIAKPLLSKLKSPKVLLRTLGKIQTQHFRFLSKEIKI